MPRGGMSSEATHCDTFTSIGQSSQIALTSGDYLVVAVEDTTLTLEMPVSLSAMVVVLGDNSPHLRTESSTTAILDENGVAWN